MQYLFSGTVLQGNARRIPDYAVVPIDGFPVDRTVKDIATNAWLVSYVSFDCIILFALYTEVTLVYV